MHPSHFLDEQKKFFSVPQLCNIFQLPLGVIPYLARNAPHGENTESCAVKLPFHQRPMGTVSSLSDLHQ